MEINMEKTVSQHVHKWEPITVTPEEIASAEVKYTHKCDFCLRKFKTSRAMQIHRASCIHNYTTTDKVFTVEKNCWSGCPHYCAMVSSEIGGLQWAGVGARTSVDTRQMSRLHKIVLDNIRSAADTRVLPGLTWENRCTVCCRTLKRPQDLKTHRKKTGPYDHNSTKNQEHQWLMQSRQSAKRSKSSYQRLNGVRKKQQTHDTQST